MRIAVLSLVLLSACSHSPIVPSRPTTFTLTVRIFEQGSELPIENAVVCGDKPPCLLTDSKGIVRVTLPNDQKETRITVRASGYNGILPYYEDVVTGNENWTFYLVKL